MEIDPSAESDYFGYWYQATRSLSDESATLQDVILFVGQIARDASDKADGRAKIRSYMRESLPLASSEGRVQVLVLSAAHHAVSAGGINGKLLAPSTLYDYFRVALPRIQQELFSNDPEALEGERFWSIYTQILDDAALPASQRSKMSSLLEVFHRYLVIVGCAPLPRCLSRGELMAPPCAAVIWEHELAAALDYVMAADVDEIVKRQATLALRLGFHIPIRACEVWCIRVGDISGVDQVVLDIYPRRRDGMRKSESTRRQVDIHDRELGALLLDLQSNRRGVYATDDCVLLGDMSSVDARYKEFVTTALVNMALKVATMDPRASFHDLRHTAFSRAAQSVLQGGQFVY